MNKYIIIVPLFLVLLLFVEHHYINYLKQSPNTYLAIFIALAAVFYFLNYYLAVNIAASNTEAVNTTTATTATATTATTATTNPSANSSISPVQNNTNAPLPGYMQNDGYYDPIYDMVPQYYENFDSAPVTTPAPTNISQSSTVGQQASATTQNNWYNKIKSGVSNLANSKTGSATKNWVSGKVGGLKKFIKTTPSNQHPSKPG